MNTKEKNKLKKDALVVQAKALKRVMGISNKKIGELLGLSINTVRRYLKITNEDVRLLEDVAKKIYLEQEVNLSNKTYSKLMERLNDPRKEKEIKFYELVGAYKIAREAGVPKSREGANVKVQVINTKDAFRIEVDRQ